jgi:hypothetical protein
LQSWKQYVSADVCPLAGGDDIERIARQQVDPPCEQFPEALATPTGGFNVRKSLPFEKLAEEVCSSYTDLVGSCTVEISEINVRPFLQLVQVRIARDIF